MGNTYGIKFKKYGLFSAKIPECVDQALSNLTEQPTKIIGSAISDAM